MRNEEMKEMKEVKVKMVMRRRRMRRREIRDLNGDDRSKIFIFDENFSCGILCLSVSVCHNNSNRKPLHHSRGILIIKHSIKNRTKFLYIFKSKNKSKSENEIP
jgi:hypothetical protein